MKLHINIILSVLLLIPGSAFGYDILFVVDNSLAPNATAQAVLADQMDNWAQDLTNYYAESNSSLNANVAGVIFRNISNNGLQTNSQTILNNMRAQTGGFENMTLLADEIGADFVAGITGNIDGCGRAWRARNTADLAGMNFAYSIQELYCGSDTLAHELGHNMGLSHGPWVEQCDENNEYSTDHVSSITGYGAGYAEADCNPATINANEFGTLMVGNYLWYFTGSNNVPNIFSNPNLTNIACGATDTCGDASSNSVTTMGLYQNYYEIRNSPDVHTLVYAPSLSNCITSKYKGVEIDAMTNLNCSAGSITAIDGVEQLTQLSLVDLSYNNIVAVSPLEKLNPSLISQINLYGNNTAICSQLKKLQDLYPGKINLPDDCFNLAAFMGIINNILL